MNAVHIVGRLVADPVLRRTQSGKVVTTLRIAVDRYAGNGETEVDYFDVPLWEKNAENAARYLGRGQRVAVSGSVTGRAYLKDGEARCQLVIAGLPRVEYLGDGRAGDAGAGDGRAGDGGPGGFTEVEDEDLPF